ncbi:MAG: hypothetical protein ACI4K7_11755 [Oscillospiraceae bacterium]
MNEVNKTLYIPLYGKAQVSRKNIILNDKKAEEIWQREQFPLKGKAKSKWLCCYMAIMEESPDALVLHIGCMSMRKNSRKEVTYGKYQLFKTDKG